MKIKTLTTRLFRGKRSYGAVIAAVLCMILGVIALLRVGAATYTFPTESELGTIAGNAGIQDDAQASAGKIVRFGITDGGSGNPNPGSGTALSWAPPALSNPMIWTPTANSRKLVAPINQDVRIVMPSTPIDWANGIEINGGRNITLIGGAFNYSQDYATSSTDEGVSNRMIYIKGNNTQTSARTVHIEGVHGIGENIFEGINVDSQSEPGLTVQIQNLRIDHIRWLHGGVGVCPSSATHCGGDALQPWNGPTTLRLDHFTVAQADYQGIFLQSDKFGSSPLGPLEFRNVNIRGMGSATDKGTTYLIAGDPNNVKTISNLWITPSPYQGTKPFYETTIWKPYVTVGDPGDFVKASTVGVGYLSPGYK
jgi:hypothetical protein